MKHITWSYSGISLFKQCPKKYHHLKVLKDFTEQETEALLYGSAVHKAAEDHITEGKPIPPQYKYMEGYMERIKAYPGVKLAKYKMAIKLDGSRCNFDAPEAWWRGIADLIILNGDTCRILDYKTGKSARYADTAQLDLLALAAFTYFPEVQNIKAALLFVVAGELVKKSYNREASASALMQAAQDSYVPLQAAYENNVWNPKPNFTCNKYCAVLSCAHNGRN
jgi:hypothetical protein